jgi:hypothetical protein
VGTWGRQPMRRAILLALACAAVAASVLAIGTTDRDRPGSAGAAATPATPSAPAQHPADRTCRQIPLPVQPTRLALVDSRLLIASRQAGSVGAAEVRACRWVATIAVLPGHAKVTPPPPQAGVINGPDRPSALAANRHDRATLLRIDPRSGRVAHRIALASDPHGVAFGSGFVWVALYHQSTIVRVDPHTNRILGPPIGAGFPTEPLASAGGHLWAIPSTGGPWPTPSCTPCWSSTPKAAASWAPIAPAAAPMIWWRPATASGWRPPSRTSSSASPAQAHPGLMAERFGLAPG